MKEPSFLVWEKGIMQRLRWSKTTRRIQIVCGNYKLENFKTLKRRYEIREASNAKAINKIKELFKNLSVSDKN